MNPPPVVRAAQGFDDVESMREAGLTDEDLQELAKEARELDNSITEVEFERAEVRERVLRVLGNDTLQHWLSAVLKGSSQRQREVGLSLQRAGFMSVADVLESSLADQDWKDLGFKQMGTRKKLLSGAQGLVASGTRHPRCSLVPLRRIPSSQLAKPFWPAQVSGAVSS